MIKTGLALIAGLMISGAASAQEFGLGIGVHQTNATVDGVAATGSENGKLGFDLGLHVGFELVPNLKFRTGFLYNQRQFDYKTTGVGTYQYNFAFIDVPINVQYSFTPMVSVFGGLIIAVKSSDSVKVPAAGVDPDVEMKSLYPLLNAGVNLMFDDMIGFDFYLERGVGEFATDQFDNSYKDYMTFGLRFLYWM